MSLGSLLTLASVHFDEFFFLLAGCFEGGFNQQKTFPLKCIQLKRSLVCPDPLQIAHTYL